MLFDVNYPVGSKVVYKKYSDGEDWIDCGFCGGTGTAIGLDGSSEVCPKCKGKMIVFNEGRNWEMATGVIDGIIVDYTVDSETHGVVYVIGGNEVYAGDVERRIFEED